MNIAISKRTPAFFLRRVTLLVALASIFLIARAGVPVQTALSAPAHATALSSEICIIPALSSPSVKNGDTVTISAVINARHGVAKVEAEIIRQRDLPSLASAGPITLHPGPSDLAPLVQPLAKVTLAPAAPGIGGVSADGTRGLWTSTWTGANLEETYYAIRIRVTDRRGQTAEDQSLIFSDPIAGLDTPGTDVYPNGGLLYSGSTPRFNFRVGHGLVDPLRGYAYFISMASLADLKFGIVKVALNAGDTPPAFMGATTLNQERIFDAAIDPQNGYAYVTNDYGDLIKVRLNAGAALPSIVNYSVIGAKYIIGIDSSTRIAYVLNGTTFKTLALGGGDAAPSQLQSANLSGDFQDGLIDPAGGYVYLTSPNGPNISKLSMTGGPTTPGGSGNSPGQLGTVNLATTGPTGGLLPIAIDPAAGYGWLVLQSSPATILKIALGQGDAMPSVVSRLQLNAGEDEINSVVVPPGSGVALLGIPGEPSARVVKIALGAGSAPPTRLGIVSAGNDDSDLIAGGFDPISQTAVFSSLFTGRVIKFDPGASMAPPQRLSATETMVGLEQVRLVLTDPFADYALVVSQGTTNRYARIRKLALGDAATMPYPLGFAVNINQSYEEVLCGVLDATGTYAYLSVNKTPGIVRKYWVRNDTPVYVGSTSFQVGEQAGTSAVIDRNRNQAWFGTNQNPGRVVKMALGSGNALPVRLGAVTLEPGETSPFTAVIDSPSGYAYFGTNTAPGRVVKVALGAGTNPPTRVGALTLDPGEDFLFSSVIHPFAGYALFGTYTMPGRIVKVNLGAGNALPTRAGGVTLAANENRPASALIDPLAGRAYFGTLNSPGKVISIGLNDPFPDPVRLGAVELPSGENELYGGVFNPVAGTAVFYSSNGQSAAHRLLTAQAQQIKLTRFELPVKARVLALKFHSHIGLGNVRLALYRDTSTSQRQLVWQSQSVPNAVNGSLIEMPIAAGMPNQLTLPTGNYHFAWQIDTTANVPSLTQGAMGDGSYLIQPYGPFPTTLSTGTFATRWTNTTERWTGYIQYESDTNTDPIWLQIGDNPSFDE